MRGTQLQGHSEKTYADLKVLLKSTEPSTPDRNGEAQLRIDSKEKTSPSTSQSQQSTVVGYQQLDLGFRCCSVDAVEVRSGEFRLLKPQRRLDELWRSAIWVVPITIFCLPAFAHFLTGSEVSPETLWTLSLYVAVPGLLLWRRSDLPVGRARAFSQGIRYAEVAPWGCRGPVAGPGPSRPMLK